MPIDLSLRTAIFDLRAFGKALPAGKQYRKLKGLIEQAMSARSAQSDLIHAAQYVDLLLARLEQPRPEVTRHAEAMIDHAILAYAIILYARATKTRSKHRVTFDDITRSLTMEESILHKQLTELRDEAIAHFGTGPVGAGFEWATEAVVLVAQPNGFRVAAVSRRALANKPFTERLRAMIERMRALVEARAREVSNDLVRELDVQALQPGFTKRVHAHAFDLVAHMGSVEGAADAMRGIAAGFGTGFSAARG